MPSYEFVGLHNAERETKIQNESPARRTGARQAIIYSRQVGLIGRWNV